MEGGPRFEEEKPSEEQEPKRESGISKMVAGDAEYQEGYLRFYKDIFENQKIQEYAEAVIAGRLLPVARLVEKTYGKGAFREMGELTKDENPK